jgi:MFS transporter, SP family, inositol transporter
MYAVGSAVLTAAIHSAMLYIGVILVGSAVGADLPVSLALIAEESPEGMKGRLVVFSGLLWVLGIVATIILTAIFSPLDPPAARILYGHLLLVAVVVVILRLGLRESAEWAAVKQAKVEGDDAVQFSAIPQLFAPPLLFTVLALGLYYALWNLTANTFGQFGAFIFVNVAHSTVQIQSLVSLASFPIGIVCGLLFMRVVDKPSRKAWFTFGTICYVVAFATPAILGGSVQTLFVALLLIGIGAAFSGETIYKVWSQELVPTLLRSTAQGLTIAFARITAALFAVITPTLIIANSRLFFGLLFALTVVSGLMGLFWVTRLPKARELEPEEAILVNKADAAQGRGLVATSGT